VVPILPENIDDVIDVIMELIGPAIARQSANISPEHVSDDLRAGQSIAWLVYNGDTLVAAITTSVLTHPLRNVLKIEFMGGKNMRQWMNEAIAFMAGVAKHAGLDALEADGRKGFDKFVDASPFRPVYTNYVMELT
jgi:hypothetical protein